MNALPLLALLTFLPLCTAGCAAQQESLQGEPLPFHVAVLPTEILDGSAVSMSPDGTAGPDALDREDMRLALTAPDVSRALANALAGAFVRTTLLEPPEDLEGFASLSERERDLVWQERARSSGADLLLRTRLLLDPRIDGERNEKFWLNLPLFLIGGPMCYFVGDRSYRVMARLQGEIYEVSGEHLDLAEFALLEIPLYVEAGEEDLRFLDRADGPSDYLVSLVVPAGLLARESARVERNLEQLVPRSLGRALAGKVLEGRATLERTPNMGGFLLDDSHVRTSTTEDGRTQVAIPIRKLAGSELLRYELRAGERLLASGEFPARAAGEQHRIEAVIDLPQDESFLRLKLVDSLSNTRGYTLPVVRLAR